MPARCLAAEGIIEGVVAQSFYRKVLRTFSKTTTRCTTSISRHRGQLRRGRPTYPTVGRPRTNTRTFSKHDFVLTGYSAVSMLSFRGILLGFCGNWSNLFAFMTVLPENVACSGPGILFLRVLRMSTSTNNHAPPISAPTKSA